MSTIKQVLGENEKILWEGKPQFLPFIGFAVPFLVTGLLFFLGTLAVGIGNDNPSAITMGVLFLLVVGVLPFVYNLLVFPHTHYVITDKRTIIQRGVIGRDFVTIEHDQVTSAKVNVGLMDKMFGKNSGSLMIIHAGGATTKNDAAVPDSLRSITDPYKVYQAFNKISHDVRSDIQFPNAMRPKENKGYETEYKA